MSRDLRPRPSADARIVALVGVLQRAELACEVEFPWRQVIRAGPREKPPICRFRLRNTNLLRRPITELSLGRAYVNGDLDIDMPDPEKHAVELFKIRDHVRSGTTPLQAVRLAAEIALESPTRANARAIGRHYNLPDDFFATFLDSRYRLYSQCRFAGRDIDIGAAADNKLEDMWHALRLEPGKRILDIGGGWGGMMEYCSSRGVEVTSLTLQESSAKAIKAHIHDERSEVLAEDLLEHRRRQYYDSVAILGVIEHIPTYARFCARVWEALKPGGRLYLDASATREKYAGSAFTRHYTWPGAHSCLALPDMQEELIFHGFAIESVREAGDDYARTMRAWAQRLDARADEVKKRYGELVYRTWRVYLWGGAAGFETGRLQAYTLVARRLEDRGPRPRLLRRSAHFVASLRR